MTPSRFSACVVIPHYNHSRALPEVLAELADFDIPIVVVDDGSAPAEQAVAREACVRHPRAKFLAHEVNRGKGAAVISALRTAIADGHTHAIQIDADGQHALGDIPKFVETARAAPESLVLGVPSFGPDAPWERVYGRKITTALLWIECGSFAVKDGMCGFRVYPLHATEKILERGVWDLRMGFDVEIIVRHVWASTPVHSIETDVSYPRDGVSHFRYLADNWKMASLHIRLLGTSLLRCIGTPWRRSTTT